MEQLFQKSRKKVANVSLDFIRGIFDEINWDARLIGIKGARGIGKTTLLLQHIKKNVGLSDEALYVSLDDIWFSDNKLIDLADEFVKKGGVFLYLDEVHKYPNWSREIKNIYDDHLELKVVFTGSSLLEILNARADLSRRAIVYAMQGLSFREYLNYSLNEQFHPYSLKEICTTHSEISAEIVQRIRPLKYFDLYLKTGYYPFFKDIPELYYYRIEEIVDMILQVELPLQRGVEIKYSQKLKQLLYIISGSAPFIPNISKLSERIMINRNTLIDYLNHLHDAGVIHMLYQTAKGITRFQKPDKIMLENTNIGYALQPDSMNKGNARETFVANQLKDKHDVLIPKEGDFLVDDSYLFEVGGKSKTNAQIRSSGYEQFIIADDIEYGMNNKIPVWLLGFLY